MKTITLIIGNTDNKLTQAEWARFVEEIIEQVSIYSSTVEFFGAPPTYSQWQNACWVITIEDENIWDFKSRIYMARVTFKQSSVAWVEGATTFV